MELRALYELDDLNTDMGEPGRQSSRSGTPPSVVLQPPTHDYRLNGGGPPDSPPPSDDGDEETNSDSESREDTDEGSERGADILVRLEGELFNVQRRQGGGARQRRRQGPLPRSRRLVTRRRYAAIQSSWRKNRSRTVKNVIAGHGPLVEPEVPDGTKEFWTALFGRPSPESRINGASDGPLINILEPVTASELKATLKGMASGKAAGPDGIKVKDLRVVDQGELKRMLNLALEVHDTTED